MLDNINEILLTATAGLAAAAVALRLLLRANRIEWLKRLMTWLLEYVDVGLSALVIALVIRSAVIEPFKIPSSSMEDTLLIGDHLFVNRFLYGLRVPFLKFRPLAIRPPRRGDIVVFIPPHQRDKDFIKRVIGLPGDVVDGHDGHVFVNGRRLLEPYLHNGQSFGDFPPVLVPPHHLWVMGDNRAHSSDSRVFGVIDEHKLIGRALLRVWPPQRVAFL
jgi:signal peptidase I